MLVNGFIEALNLPVDEVQQLRTEIEEYAGNVVEFEPVQVRPTSFGGSDVGASLGHHAGLAEQALVQALQDVVTGLRSQADGLHEFAKDVEATDEGAGVAMTLLQRGVECVSAPTSYDPSACPPASSGGED